MFNSPFLDIAIGMVFIFLLYSILATAIQEIIATAFKMRGKYLFKAIIGMLRDNHLGDQLSLDFKNHPLIRKINFTGEEILPSYIKPETFSIVMQDILPDLYLGKNRSLTPLEKIKLLPDGELKKTLLTYISHQTLTVDESLQQWFDTTMERLTGAYKRMTQYNVLLIGLVLAILFNVNAIAVFSRLSSDKTAREKLVKQATEFANANTNYDSLMSKYRSQAIALRPKDSAQISDSIRAASLKDSALLKEFDRQRKEIKNLLDSSIQDANNTVGIGWSTLKGNDLGEKIKNQSAINRLIIVAGWIITALAITLGAPFWFDLLQKLIRIRGSGNRPLTDTEREKLELKK